MVHFGARTGVVRGTIRKRYKNSWSVIIDLGGCYPIYPRNDDIRGAIPPPEPTPLYFVFSSISHTRHGGFGVLQDVVMMTSPKPKRPRIARRIKAGGARIVQARADDEHIAVLDELARRRSTSRSEILRAAIREAAVKAGISEERQDELDVR